MSPDRRAPDPFVASIADGIVGGAALRPAPPLFPPVPVVAAPAAWWAAPAAARGVSPPRGAALNGLSGAYGGAPRRADRASYLRLPATEVTVPRAPTGDVGCVFDGCVLERVVPGTQADVHGLGRYSGRTVTHVNGAMVFCLDDLYDHAARDMATLRLTFAAIIVPTPPPPPGDAPPFGDAGDLVVDKASMQAIGVRLDGMRVAEVREGSPAKRQGVDVIAAGQMLTHVDGEPVDTIEEVASRIVMSPRNSVRLRFADPVIESPRREARAGGGSPGGAAGGAEAVIPTAPGGGLGIRLDDMRLRGGGGGALAGFEGRRVTHIDGAPVCDVTDVRRVCAAGSAPSRTLRFAPDDANILTGAGSPRRAPAGSRWVADEVSVEKGREEAMGVRLEAMSVADAEPASPAHRGGVRSFVGHRLTHVDGVPVGSCADVRAQSSPKARVRLRFAPPGPPGSPRSPPSAAPPPGSPPASTQAASPPPPGGAAFPSIMMPSAERRVEQGARHPRLPPNTNPAPASEVDVWLPLGAGLGCRLDDMRLSEVHAGSPADAAGAPAHVGRRLTHVCGHPVARVGDIQRVVAAAGAAARGAGAPATIVALRFAAPATTSSSSTSSSSSTAAAAANARGGGGVFNTPAVPVGGGWPSDPLQG